MKLSASVSASVKSGMENIHPAKLLIRLVRPARLERATFWFVAKRSIQLSYGRLRRMRILPSDLGAVNGASKICFPAEMAMRSSLSARPMLSVRG